MSLKRTAIALLVGLNLLLLTALVFSSYSLPAVYAQGNPRAGDFICATAEVGGQRYDVLYVVDLPSRKLHAFYSTSARGKQLMAAPPRDLARDFAR